MASRDQTPLGSRLKRSLTNVPTAVLWIIVAIWTLPTIGLFVSSVRSPELIEEEGWWTIGPNAVEAGLRSDADADRFVAEETARQQAEFDARAESRQAVQDRLDDLPEEELEICDPDAAFDPGALLGGTPDCIPAEEAGEEAEVDGDEPFDPGAILGGGGSGTDRPQREFTPNVDRPPVGVGDSLGRDLSLDNYDQVLFGTSGGRDTMITHFWNSLAIVIPATLIPIAIAAFAAYAFAWMDFRFKNWLFVGLVSLMALPNQMAFVPLLSLYNRGGSWTVPFTDTTLRLIPEVGLANSSSAVWLTHTAFGLPLAIFLLHNYMSGLPGDVIEAARIDGASHFTIFRKIVLPLSIPALAAFGIFQFLWTWNDFLIASIFLNAGNGEPMTVAVAQLQGMFGDARTLRFAAAFVTMIVPMLVFFSMQKHFVRGLLAGSVKG